MKSKLSATIREARFRINLLAALSIALLWAALPTAALGQVPLCLSNGQIVNGGTTGLDVQPCAQPATVDAANAADAPLDPVLDDPAAGKQQRTVLGI